jgi:hypothetical protein
MNTFAACGCLSTMKRRSGVFSYWQTEASTSGAVASAGNRRATKARAAAAPAALGGDLEAASAARGDSVEHALAEIDPDGQGVVREPRVPGRRPEHERLLARRPHPVADEGREEPAEPGAAGEDVPIRGEGRPVTETQRPRARHERVVRADHPQRAGAAVQRHAEAALVSPPIG